MGVSRSLQKGALALFSVFFASVLTVNANEPLWKCIEQTMPNEVLPTTRGPRSVYVLNSAELDRILAQTPTEIPLPLPDGNFACFKITRSSVVPRELAEKFPALKTFVGWSRDNQPSQVALDSTSTGFRAQIVSPDGVVFVEPATVGSTNLCISYFKQSGRRSPFKCLTGDAGPKQEYFPLAHFGVQRGGKELRTYRLAVAASGEFTQTHGGTVSSTLSAIVAIVNRVNALYQAELGIQFVLVANEEKIIFTDPSNDPYTENAATSTTILQNQNTIDQLIGSGNYDIGHLFNTGEFGLANVGTVCADGWKARGCMGTSTPGGEDHFAEYVAHEMAHQFGAYHTFNSLTGTCNGNRHAASAYEPGSGSTIMSYAGWCSDDDLQSRIGSYFHSTSYDEIMNFVTGGNGSKCPVITGTGNNPPNVDAGPGYTIPRETPFRLTATGSDPDGDAVTFCWEERDLGPPQSVYDSDNGSSPLFRSLFPSTSPTRYFPRLSEYLDGLRLRGEQLPSTQRTLNFRVTARDGRGGIATSDTQVFVANAGPFAITSHNSGDTVSGAQKVTWNVAGTDRSPINVSSVNILLSTDGGNSFNTILAANTPNDGAETILFPAISTSSARLKIEAVGNIFFAINERNFSIVPPGDVRTDVNYDGQLDIIWQHDNGTLAAWFLNGTDFSGAGLLRNGKPVPPGWRLVGFGNFNGDAAADFVVQNSDGNVVVWFMDGLNQNGGGRIQNAPASPNLRVVGVGDFNANGYADLLLQENNGLVMWFLNGLTVLKSASVRSVPSGWHVVGAPDFNRDGRADILLQNDNGAVAVWYMNGAAVVRGELLRNGQAAGPGWRLAGFGDFNSDQNTDLLWQHTNGRAAIWFMNGSAFGGAVLLRDGQSAGAGWKIAGPK